MRVVLLTLIIGLFTASNAHGAEPNLEDLRMKYDDLLLFKADDYAAVDRAEHILQTWLLREFKRAIRNAKRFDYELEGQPAYFDFKVFAEDNVSEAIEIQNASNERLANLMTKTLPMLAYAYLTPGANPYHQSEEVLELYVRGLSYCYGRGLNEDAWMTDHAGRASGQALRQGHVRAGGDFSSISLHFGGLIQSVFLMRGPLDEAGQLDRFRAVLRNLVINNGTMYPAFYQVARADAGMAYGNVVTDAQAHYLNADGIRLFTDYFYPYFLLIEDEAEKKQMADILRSVIHVNVALKCGTQDTIKPDGVGFHHNAAYVGGYSPYAFEAFAQLLYLLADTGYFTPENVDAAKQALEAFRVMTQQYTVSSSLRGRLIDGDSMGASTAVTKAMCLLAHPDGLDDVDMKQRFAEFFDPDVFLSDEEVVSYSKGKRGVPIRGLGIYRLIADLRASGVTASPTPSGTWIKPYAVAAFHRRDDWLVTVRGFSRYFWDYEGPLNKHQNSFGQNWANGLLQVFCGRDPISEAGSGYDLENGWDWYHVPGTTASHYPTERRTLKSVEELREKAGIVQRSVHRNYSSRTFVGGVSLGEHGMFVQDLEAVPFTSPTDLTARKSYYFVGDKVLALGSQISGGTAEDETHTTLFQTRLKDEQTRTFLGGQPHTGLDLLERLPAGQSVSLTDGIGSSFYLAESSSELVVSRKMQSSMTPRYEPTEGAYVQAWLDHGIKPSNDHYEYVVIPADRGARKLKELAEDPSVFYQVVKTDSVHLVVFPEERITAYGFFETVETPESQLVKCASHQATVMTREDGDDVVLAASVPDLGWKTDLEALRKNGLSYANKHYIRQEAKEHRLQLVLRGAWSLVDGTAGTDLSVTNGETILELNCKDGLTNQVQLTPAD